MVVCARPAVSLCDTRPVQRLSERFLNDMMARGLPSTMRQKYMDAVAGFVEHHKQRTPARLGADDVTSYLLHLAVDKHMGLLEQKTIVCGLRFFYGVTLRRPWAYELDVVIAHRLDGSAAPAISKVRVFSKDRSIRERMMEDMTLRGLSDRTQETYVGAVKDFVRFHGGAPPGRLGPDEVKAYQLHLIRTRKLATKSVTVYVCALRFLYKVTLQKTWAIDRIVYGKSAKPLPEIASPTEIAHLLASAESLRDRVMLSAAYGCGLRRAEVARLRVEDIDAARNVVRVVEGKGRKDRFVMLSPALLAMVQDYIAKTQPQRWLFPGLKPETHICGDTINYVCRHTLARSGLTRPINIRLLRHAFACHLLENGTELSVIQTLLGHTHIRTTQIYTRVAAHTICATRSPLDLLPTPPSSGS